MQIEEKRTLFLPFDLCVWREELAFVIWRDLYLSATWQQFSDKWKHSQYDINSTVVDKYDCKFVRSTLKGRGNGQQGIL